MKKAPQTPKKKKSLIDVRLKHTRKKVGDLADSFYQTGRYSKLGAYKAAIKELQIDEMLEEELRKMPDYPD